MDELSPHLSDVKERFITNLRQGGLPACRTMVNDLATELETLRTLSAAAADAHSETILAQDDLSDEEIAEKLGLTLGITDELLNVMSRHSFAAWLLQVTEDVLGPSE